MVSQFGIIVVVGKRINTGAQQITTNLDTRWLVLNYRLMKIRSFSEIKTLLFTATRCIEVATINFGLISTALRSDILFFGGAKTFIFVQIGTTE